MKHFTFYGFTTKKALTLLCICIFPIVIFCIYYVTRNVTSIQERQNEIIENQLEQSSKELSENLQQITNLRSHIYANHSLNNYFLKNFYTDAELILKYINEIAPTITWIQLLKTPSIKSIDFYTQNTVIPETVNIFHINSSSEIYQADDGPYIKKLNNDVVLVSLMNAQFSGKNTYLSLSLDTEKLFEGFKLFAHNNSSYLRISTKNGEHLVDYNEFNIDIPKNLDTLKEGTCVTIDGNPYILKRLNFEYGLTATLLLSLNSATEEIQSFIGTISIIFGISTLCLAFIFISYFYFSMKRLHGIIQALDNINTEEFNINIPHSDKDIIDSLANSINVMSQKIRSLIEKVYYVELNEKKMMISALQKQINPHFLYNTLECIRMKLEINEQQEISDNIESLGCILRYNISVNKNFETIDNELKLLHHYINIQNLINNNQIEFCTQFHNVNLKRTIPRFCLQPIIENSIEHGFNKGSENKLYINLSIVENSKSLMLIIEDNGMGASEETIKKINDSFLDYRNNIPLDLYSGVALKNINSRIKILFGENYGLSIGNSPVSGIKVVVTLPGDTLPQDQDLSNTSTQG